MLFAIYLIAAAFVSTLTHASPLLERQSPQDTSAAPISFDNWGGISSLSNFDSFNGVDNFDGSGNSQVIVEEESVQVICVQQDVLIIQQQLAILQELAKRIVTEQVCEVEVQTIVLEQFQGGMSSFSLDIERESTRVVGFDSNIASMISSLLNSDGSFNNNDFGFSGSNVGNSTIVPSGSNWNDDGSSKKSVMQASADAKASSNATSADAATRK